MNTAYPKNFKEQPTYNMNRLPTMYPTSKEALRVLSMGIQVLTEKTLEADNEGFYSITDLCSKLKSMDSSLYYLTRNHIVELFFRDTTKKIMISGEDKIKYKEVKYVEPPETLFFGTVSTFKDKMRKQGLFSVTKGYIKLYDTPEAAKEYAKKFLREGEETDYLEVCAKEAYCDGLSFSTYKDGEFCVVKISTKYIR